MAEPGPRRGGWPGPPKPKWSFRPTASTEAVVATYITAHGLDAERDRSRAINALLELAAPAEHSHDWECCETDGCCEHCFSAPGA